MLDSLPGGCDYVSTDVNLDPVNTLESLQLPMRPALPDSPSDGPYSSPAGVDYDHPSDQYDANPSDLAYDQPSDGCDSVLPSLIFDQPSGQYGAASASLVYDHASGQYVAAPTRLVCGQPSGGYGTAPAELTCGAPSGMYNEVPVDFSHTPVRVYKPLLPSREGRPKYLSDYREAAAADFNRNPLEESPKSPDRSAPYDPDMIFDFEL